MKGLLLLVFLALLALSQGQEYSWLIPQDLEPLPARSSRSPSQSQSLTPSPRTSTSTSTDVEPPRDATAVKKPEANDESSSATVPASVPSSIGMTSRTSSISSVTMSITRSVSSSSNSNPPAPAPGLGSNSSSSHPEPPPSPSPAPSDTSSTTPAEETSDYDDDCYEQTNYEDNEELVQKLQKYDLAKILEDIGGSPGKVNATWSDAVEEFPVVENITQRPLPDTDNSSYWIYDYRATDFKTFIRLEHALLRLKGAAEEFVDIRGELYWTPPDFCSGEDLRHAEYRQDDTGFHYRVLTAHCHIFRGDKSLSCYGPDSENPCAQCITGLSGSLIASLVG